jgi:hypothetical protein
VDVEIVPNHHIAGFGLWHPPALVTAVLNTSPLMAFSITRARHVTEVLSIIADP